MSASGSATTGAIVVGFGAGSLDVYCTPGDVGTKHAPGGKGGWRDEEQSRYDAIAASPDHSGRLHVGGNIINCLAPIAGEVEARFVGVLGDDDPVSAAIRLELGRFGIINNAVVVPGYLPSIGLIEREEEPGSDRMVRGRPRHSMDEHLSDTHLASAAAGARLAMVSSIKVPELTERIFDAIPPATRLSYNPGGSEFSRPHDVLGAMNRRKPDLLAANNDELQQLFPDIAGAEALALAAGEHAEYVLCTLGSAGILLAHNGDVIRHKGQRVPDEHVRDTCGAGDRTHSVTAFGLFVSGEDPHTVLAKAAESAAQVIQHVGAHGNLYRHVGEAIFNL